MSAVPHPHTAAPAEEPIVIVGSGPVGVRFARELRRHSTSQPIVLYGAEAHEPYNRVRLSSFLAGDLGWDELTRDLTLPNDPLTERRFGCAVVSIDRDAQTVRDAWGRVQKYSQLVLATGSTPRVPNVPNIALPGVYTFRDFNDAQKLFARRVRSRCTVVLGGGLLGLEAARAMRRFHTQVIVVEHTPRLMSRQLDAAAAEMLRIEVERMGMQAILADGLKRVLGGERVSGVELMSGRRIDCDTLILATGISPNIELARKAGLSVDRGIRVDDSMRCSDARVFAIGECAEHRATLYGLVAPGVEQATVAAAQATGGEARYLGSVLATRLKVVGVPVFSVGRVVEDELGDLSKRVTYRAADGASYCKVVVERGRLVGAVAIGAIPDLRRLQEAVTRHHRVHAWQLWRFRSTGLLWPEQETVRVVAWPSQTTVCSCTGVTRGQLGAAMSAGCTSVTQLAARTGASTVCGSCRPLLAELVGNAGPATPEQEWKWLLGTGVVVLLAAAITALPFNVPYTQIADVQWQWDLLWRDTGWKQTSGFTVLGLSVLALLMSLRKRVPRLGWGRFSIWRVAHVLIGVLTLAGLWVHSGGRLGSNLNAVLMTCFVGLLAVGSLAGGAIALEHRFGRAAAQLRKQSVWIHILLFWPVPVLLGFHILKTYYF